MELFLDTPRTKILYEEYKLQISLSYICFTLLLLLLSSAQISSRATSTYNHALKWETKFHTQYETTDKIKVLSVLYIFMFSDKETIR
jgi:hypothetical protein